MDKKPANAFITALTVLSAMADEVRSPARNRSP